MIGEALNRAEGQESKKVTGGTRSSELSGGSWLLPVKQMMPSQAPAAQTKGAAREE